MPFSEREVTLKLDSRPLRLVYLVGSKEDLINAVTFYTHIWGGAANVILPMPENDVEANTLKLALKSLNPDYIFIPSEGTPSDVTQVLEQFPVWTFPVSREGIERHVNDSLPLPSGSYTGRLPHIGSILARLQPTPLTDSEIHFVESGSPFDFELALQGGVPSQNYQNYLRQHPSASVFPSPKTAEQLVKVSLLLTIYKNPVSLTLPQSWRSESPVDSYNTWTDHQKALYLFLSDGEDIGVATAFWNSRWSLPHNKLFLVKEVFLSDINRHTALIVEAMPSIQALFVTTPLESENALALANLLSQAFAAAGREILVEVYYRNFSFNFIKSALYWGQSFTTTCVIASDGSIRFSPSVPDGHENGDFIFGYDAEVTLASGRRLFIPATKSAAVLLSYRLEEIESVEKNESLVEMQDLERNSTVRSAAKGITGTAIYGKECRLYVPTDDVIVTRQLKDAGFEVKPNKHTRYTQGFIRRLGGFENTMRLVNQGGLKIISVLKHPQAKAAGLNFKQATEFMSQGGISKQEARNVLEQQLPLLLSSGLVRRGYSLTCSHCDLTDWYSIENVGEFVECVGCAERFQLKLKSYDFAYRPNELAARFVEEGGKAILMTTALFNQIQRSGFIQFGGDLLRPGDRRAFAEVDLFWITSHAFTVAECKSYQEISQEDITQIKLSLEKTIEVATLLNAQVVVLGVVTNLPKPELYTAVADAAERAKQQGIGVHLALNGKLHLRGSIDGTEPWKVRLRELQIEELPTEEKHSVSVGELPKQGVFGGSGLLFNDEVLSHWQQEIGETLN